VLVNAIAWLSFAYVKVILVILTMEDGGHKEIISKALSLRFLK